MNSNKNNNNNKNIGSFSDVQDSNAQLPQSHSLPQPKPFMNEIENEKSEKFRRSTSSPHFSNVGNDRSIVSNSDRSIVSNSDEFEIAPVRN
jgi:hypothetical protein